MSPTQDTDLSEAVTWMVVQRLQQLPLVKAGSSDEGSSSEQEQPTARRHWPLKSGMHHMRATIVIKRITWPHGVMYSAAIKPAVYGNLSMAWFVQGYLIVRQGEEGDTKDKMEVHLLRGAYGWMRPLWLVESPILPWGLAEPDWTRMAHMGWHGGESQVSLGASLVLGNINILNIQGSLGFHICRGQEVP